MPERYRNGTPRRKRNLHNNLRRVSNRSARTRNYKSACRCGEYRKPLSGNAPLTNRMAGSVGGVKNLCIAVQASRRPAKNPDVGRRRNLRRRTLMLGDAGDGVAVQPRPFITRPHRLQLLRQPPLVHRFFVLCNPSVAICVLLDREPAGADAEAEGFVGPQLHARAHRRAQHVNRLLPWVPRRTAVVAM